MRFLVSLLLGLVLFTSCSKQEIDVCGVIEGGYSEFDEFTGRTSYYFIIYGEDRYVDELTYMSFRVGESVCLDY